MKARQHAQADVEDEVLEVLEHGGIMSTQQISRLVKAELDLLPGDILPANKRPNEQRIDQIIANSLQSKRRLCAQNLIERVSEGEFRITETGRTYLGDRRTLRADMAALLPDDL